MKNEEKPNIETNIAAALTERLLKAITLVMDIVRTEGPYQQGQNERIRDLLRDAEAAITAAASLPRTGWETESGHISRASVEILLREHMYDLSRLKVQLDIALACGTPAPKGALRKLTGAAVTFRGLLATTTFGKSLERSDESADPAAPVARA